MEKRTLKDLVALSKVKYLELKKFYDLFPNDDLHVLENKIWVGKNTDVCKFPINEIRTNTSGITNNVFLFHKNKNIEICIAIFNLWSGYGLPESNLKCFCDLQNIIFEKGYEEKFDKKLNTIYEDEICQIDEQIKYAIENDEDQFYKIFAKKYFLNKLGLTKATEECLSKVDGYKETYNIFK